MCAKTIYEYTPDMDHFLISPGSIDEYLHFAELFGNQNPVEIEIGAGKGRFILAESKRRPDTNFLAIERSLRWIRVAVLRAAKDPCPNLRFLCLNADFVLKLLILPQSVQAYHVYFPDPWPKDRHQKRRLFNKRFIEKMAESLKDNGKLYLKSDHQYYFEETHTRIKESGLFTVLDEQISDETIGDFDEADESATHYEIKWRLEARKIFSTVYQVNR